MTCIPQTSKRHAILLWLVIPLTVQFAVACSASQQPIQGERWVIFSAKQAREQGMGDWFLANPQTAEYWTPSAGDIFTLEERLVPYLQDHPDDRFSTQQVPIWERLSQYDRQYIGIVLDGKQIVYANYFCDSLETDWKKEFVFVLDGGDCFFQFKYDVDSGEFFDLQVNGVAHFEHRFGSISEEL
jgi:hypothetical protein